MGISGSRVTALPMPHLHVLGSPYCTFAEQKETCISQHCHLCKGTEFGGFSSVLCYSCSLPSKHPPFSFSFFSFNFLRSFPFSLWPKSSTTRFRYQTLSRRHISPPKSWMCQKLKSIYTLIRIYVWYILGSVLRKITLTSIVLFIVETAVEHHRNGTLLCDPGMNSPILWGRPALFAPHPRPRLTYY